MSELVPIANLRGPIGPTGPRGIGWNETSLGANQNLNALDVGLFRQSNGAVSSLELNYPTANFSGSIEVVKWGASEVIQTATPIPSSTTNGIVGFYRRGLRSNWWSNWKFFPSQRVDNTAGRVIYTWDETTNREQMIYGDTGLRDISSLLTGVTIPSGTTPTLRRVGSKVTLTLNGVSPAEDLATGFLEMLTLPQGFRSPTSLNMYIAVNTGNSPIKSFQLTNGYMVRLYQTPVKTDQIREIVIYDTNDPWPTVLPGVAK